MAIVLDWVARLVGGREVRKGDALLPEIAPGTLDAIRVTTDQPGMEIIDVALDPGKGHHATVFTRVMLGFEGQKRGVPVIQVVLDPAEPDRWVRLYVAPDGRLILSTRDTYW